MRENEVSKGDNFFCHIFVLIEATNLWHILLGEYLKLYII